MLITPRELATMRAAFLFWKEELCPHDDALMWPYLESADYRPLTSAEIDLLRADLVPANLRYALYDRVSQHLAGIDLFSSVDEALRHACTENAIVTVLIN